MAYWSERKLIERIKSAVQESSSDVLLSIGDDCCELATGACTLVSTDTLVDSVHFDTSFHSPYLLGRKSIAVNLSDIAAMGGTPHYVLLSLCLPENLDEEWIHEWIDGALSILKEFDCILVGGDTVKGRGLVFTVTVIGEPNENGTLYRSGASNGESLWVTGVLGSAGAGLELLKIDKNRHGTIDLNCWATLCEAHLDPLPQVHLGQKLARSGCVTAMQDLSDGLATDLGHMCYASKVSATIEPDLLPMHTTLEKASELLDMSLLDLMLRAGEDYQLVFTVKKGTVQAFLECMKQNKQNITQIGTIIEGNGVLLEENEKVSDISFQGYEH